jgi:phosphoenolpyruvate-protein phosphotransferase
MPEGRLTGLAAVPGIAVGPAWVWRGVTGGSGNANGSRHAIPLREAAALAGDELTELAERLRSRGREDDAAILEAQALMAADAALLADAQGRIDRGATTEGAIVAAGEQFAETLEALDDPILSARAADVRDVSARIARIATGRVVEMPAVPSIAIADDLPPSITAEIPDGLLLGIALAGSSPTAHAAILARSRGIPAVVAIRGLGDALGSAASPGVVAIDGETGQVLLDPTADTLAELDRRVADRRGRADRAAALRGHPARAQDGRAAAILANIGSTADAHRALELGAEGVGLFRTEFLFLGRDRAPSEDEQAAAYREVFEAFGPDRPVVVRLLDIGGDKEVPYLGLAAEPNPFLGVRGIRLARVARDLFVGQVRAILRAAAQAAVTPSIMAPMVATEADVELLLDLVSEAGTSLRGTTAPSPRVGIMVEVPSAVFLAAELARRVAFFSIGTNDLTQYILAADRSNGAVADYQDALQPAVVRAIGSIVDAAHAANVDVAVCGELAGRPDGALVLVGLGVDELSMDARSMDDVRLAITEASAADLDARLRAALGR